MSRDTPSPPSAAPLSTTVPVVPPHWTPEQALAVFEWLQALRQALWTTYGPQLQQAWRDQLMPEGQPPELDPDEPFRGPRRPAAQRPMAPRGAIGASAFEHSNPGLPVLTENRVLTSE